MLDFLRARTLSLSTVLLILLLSAALQGDISYTVVFGRLNSSATSMLNTWVSTGWLVLRAVLLVAMVVL